jgi:poly(A) polymerase
VAALLLPTVARRYPIGPGANLEDAHEAIAGPVDALTHRYQISAHIRHQAREILLSCYRIARGKAYRTKGKFVKKPEFQEAWTFVQAWSHVTGDLGEVIEYWTAYLGGTKAGGEAGAGGGRRRRRRPRRRRGPTAEGAQPE